MKQTEMEARNVEILTRYLAHVIEPLVAPHAVAITHRAGQGEHTWRVEVPGEAMRFALGKRGANAEAIRTLMRARSGAMDWGRHVMVDVKIRAVDCARP